MKGESIRTPALGCWGCKVSSECGSRDGPGLAVTYVAKGTESVRRNMLPYTSTTMQP